MSIALHTAKLAVQHYLQGNAQSYHAEANRQLQPQIWRAELLYDYCGLFANII